jgi:hypothetical protein
MARTFLSLGNEHEPLHHPLEVCIREDKYTWERGAGLGLVVAASFSVICSGLHYELIQLLCNGQNFSLIGKLASTITTVFGSMFKGKQVYLGDLC